MLLLATLLDNADGSLARAAACALGRIGDPQAAAVLVPFARQVPAGMKPAAVDACLVCAERLLADGRRSEAVRIYQSLSGQEQGELVRVAATRGLLAARAADEELLDVVVNLVAGKDKDLRALGFQWVREGVKGRAATQRLAGLVPKLPPDAQAGLLDALAVRGDDAARPVVLEAAAEPRGAGSHARLSRPWALGHGGRCAALGANAGWGRRGENGRPGKSHPPGGPKMPIRRFSPS